MRQKESGSLQPGDPVATRRHFYRSRFFFDPEVSSCPHHGHNGCRDCGFLADSTGCTDPRCTQAGSSARVVEQDRRCRGRDTDNDSTDRRSGALDKPCGRTWSLNDSLPQVTTKIIKHSLDSGSNAHGLVLGLDLDGVLEISNCFPLPNQAPDEDEKSLKSVGRCVCLFLRDIHSCPHAHS